MIRVKRAHLNVVARTHPGKSGKNNEDRFAVSAYQVGPANPIPALFAVVADGIGGHVGGELAAEMAVNAISHSVAQSDGFDPLVTLLRAFEKTSKSITRRANDAPQYMGMGATCACAWVIGYRLYTASVGDSRIYLVRARDARQLTTDHTWIREAIEKGIISPEQARGNPNIHVIRRYLGSPKPPEADLRMRVRGDENDRQAEMNQGFLLIPGDTLLLCTDGLTDEVSDRELLHAIIGRIPAVRLGQDLEQIADRLIDLANDHGGKDNITVVLLQIPEEAPPGRLSWHLNKIRK